MLLLARLGPQACGSSHVHGLRSDSMGPRIAAVWIQDTDFVMARECCPSTARGHWHGCGPCVRSVVLDPVPVLLRRYFELGWGASPLAASVPARDGQIACHMQGGSRDLRSATGPAIARAGSMACFWDAAGHSARARRGLAPRFLNVLTRRGQV